jgi:hypothetical protein
VAAEGTKGAGKPLRWEGASEIPALKPYRGKPAVRNFRGGNGNVGIIRSPVRAIALPDRRKYPQGSGRCGRYGAPRASLAPQVSLRRFHGNVPQQKLNPYSPVPVGYRRGAKC